MKFFNLLAMGMIVCSGVTVQAQTVFQQDFSAEQTAQPTDPAYYEFINLQKDAEGNLVDKWGIVDGALSMENSVDFPCTNQTWQRGLKFRNLPLKEKTLYKISFEVTADLVVSGQDEETFEPILAPGYVDVKLMQGDENADICLLNASGAENRANITLSKNGTQKIEEFFYFADLKMQNAKYEEQCAGKPNYAPGKFFTSINVYAPGKYTVDNFLLEEVKVKNAEYANGDELSVIGVNFGSETNVKDLVAKSEDNGVLILPAGSVQLFLNGEEAEILAAELRADGKLYVFAAPIEEGTDIKVKFNNPEDEAFKLKFISDPEADASFEQAVVPAGDGSKLLDITPWAFTAPKLVSTSPIDKSFALPGDIYEIKVVLDHAVATVDEGENTAIIAMLDGNPLKIKEGTPAFAKEITFVREGSDLAKGMHRVVLSAICTEASAFDEPITFSFETGEVLLAQTIYTDHSMGLLAGANGGQPTGWKIMVGGENWTGGDAKADNGSACRNLNVTGTETDEEGKPIERTAFYLCDRDGYTYMVTGDTEENRITVPAGNVEFSVIALSHDNAGNVVEFRVEDLDGNVLATNSGACNIIANTQYQSIAASDVIAAKFQSAAEQNVVLKVRAPQGGYTAVRVLGYKVRTYVETQGDKFEPEIVFDGKFTGANMPAEGSGWLCYDNNNQLTPGSGRNGTSGLLERNFHANMPSAAFFRECGANENAAHRIEYGNGNGVEGGFSLEPGSYEITYYAGTWNDGGGNAAGTSKVFMQFIDAESGEVVLNSEHVNKANFENGGACNGQADKVTLNFNTNGGSYIVKAWGTNNTVWGSLSIEKEGSQAAKWYSKLAGAVEEAKGELTKSESEELDGTVKTALTEAIAKYETPKGMYTEEAFQSAIDELAANQEAMALRRETVGKYNDVMGKIGSILTTADAKFQVLDCYKTLDETYQKYQAVPAKDLENEELVPVTATLQFSYDTTNHMVSEGVPTLTEQITKLAEGNDNEKVQELVAKVVTDDQELAHLLRLMKTKAIYDQIAAFQADVEGAKNPFAEKDPETFDETATPIDLTPYVQNPNVYCVAEKHDAVNISNYPGWNIEEGQESHGLRPNYGWGGWTGSATHLINNNMFLGIGWEGDYGVNVWTNVNSLPVGVYNISIETMDRSGAGDWVDGANTWPNPERQKSYIFYQQEGMEEAVQQMFDCTDIGQYYAFTKDTFKEDPKNNESPVKDIVLDGETTAAVKLGAYIHAQESFAAIQKVKISMKGAKEGFDYAAAAKVLQEEIDKLLGGQSGVFGDVNGDNEVDVIDLNIVSDVMCGGAENPKADVNKDNAVDVIDLNIISDIMCGGK